MTGPIASGAITVSSGAGASGGSYRFGQSSTTADLPDPDGTTRYRGSVRFTGHHGELDLALSDPAIRVSGSSGVLSIAATGHGRLDLVTLDLAEGRRSTGDGAVTYTGVPTQLTKAGAAVFSYNGNAFYPAGTRLDPVSFTIGARSSIASGTRLVAAAVTPSASASPPAEATPTADPAELAGCPMGAATLSWGFKESFRAYVSGTIANGDWTTSGNASYQTPLFTWSSGSGVRADDGAGRLGFTGEIRFTGHHGALDTSIANPVVEFTGPEAATIVVDYAGSTMDAALSGADDHQETPDVPFVELQLGQGTISTTGDLVTIEDIPAILTDAGSAAFPNYAAGTAFDPVTLSYRPDGDCGTGTASPTAPVEGPSAAPSAGDPSVPPTAPPAASSQPGWVPWVGGGVIGAVLASAATAFLVRRQGAAG